MKKMYKSRNEENLLPFHIIKAASEGDVSAINAVLKHYEGYIIKLDFKAVLAMIMMLRPNHFLSMKKVQKLLDIFLTGMFQVQEVL